MYTLANLRKREKLAQHELAKIVGVTGSSIALYETGKRTPSLPVAIKIATFFGVSVEEIIFKSS